VQDVKDQFVQKEMQAKVGVVFEKVKTLINLATAYPVKEDKQLAFFL